MAELMRLAKYLKKFTDVRQFAYLVSIQRGLNRMLGFFLAMGVGRKLAMGGLVDRELTLASGKQTVKSDKVIWYVRDQLTSQHR